MGDAKSEVDHDASASTTSAVSRGRTLAAAASGAVLTLLMFIGPTSSGATTNISGPYVVLAADPLSYFVPCFVVPLLLARNSREGVVMGGASSFFGYMGFLLTLAYITDPAEYHFDPLSEQTSIVVLLSGSAGVLGGILGGVAAALRGRWAHPARGPDLAAGQPPIQPQPPLRTPSEGGYVLRRALVAGALIGLLVDSGFAGFGALNYLASNGQLQLGSGGIAYLLMVLPLFGFPVAVYVLVPALFTKSWQEGLLAALLSFAFVLVLQLGVLSGGGVLFLLGFVWPLALIIALILGTVGGSLGGRRTSRRRSLLQPSSNRPG